MSKRPLQPQTPTHSVIHGDEIYFQHARHGPLTGRVVAVGRDGCQVAHELAGEAKYLPVTWDAIHGHKARAQRQFALVDQGEDGAIVEDETGQRAFLRGELPAEDDPDEPVDEPVRKACGHPVEDRLPRLDAPRPSCPPRPPMPKLIPLLFLKAFPSKPHDEPGDKPAAVPADGVKPATKPKPQPPAVGDLIKFACGDFVGKGKVVAVGDDGLTIADSTGREHGVHWDEITAIKRVGKAEPEEEEPEQAEPPKPASA